MPLPLRTLGRNGPQVSPVGLGFGSIGGFYGPAGTVDERVALLDHAHATGLLFWDLADVYIDSEDVVGEWVKRSGKRDDIFLATKFGLLCQSDGSHKFRSDPDYVKTACEKSLRRLGVDTIDLYYCHRVDGVTPIEKTVEAMVELKNQGKIRYLGLSGVSASTLRRAHAIHPITTLQMEYSLFNLDIESQESGILQTCRELGVTVVAYCPIGRGILTGQFQSHADLPDGDLRRSLPKFSAKNFPGALSIVRKLKEIGDAHGITAAQVALAWLLGQGPDIVPIPGTKSTAWMDENIGAAGIQLSDHDLQEIRTLVERTKIEGSQYDAA
ncbi:hypothetical protein N7520_009105 [Penicillium odoratum]|uniref:uncharacterized protein n=1 Tax=Penicillium odoratum TaxID=1167516 RepID=UPI002548AE0B|nr:uncharacterized protein N7520_009105 [Penicillium odoratum]KAJ5752188.1 hypothetical protein N7520_009105 [Penicillium odoratum]